jgi:hypothetical protein
LEESEEAADPEEFSPDQYSRESSVEKKSSINYKKQISPLTNQPSKKMNSQLYEEVEDEIIEEEEEEIPNEEEEEIPNEEEEEEEQW